ncbi:MAG: DUF721 domain-containing protein [Chitinophagales bacterium]
MKRGNDQTIKDALTELLDSYHLNERVNELRLKQNWEQLFGKTIARYTLKISVRNKKLFLHLDSGPLRQELSYSKEKIKDRINEFIAPGFVEEIVLQ